MHRLCISYHTISCHGERPLTCSLAPAALADGCDRYLSRPLGPYFSSMRRRDTECAPKLTRLKLLSIPSSLPGALCTEITLLSHQSTA
jgi:hypothetical protein